MPPEPDRATLGPAMLNALTDIASLLADIKTMLGSAGEHRSSVELERNSRSTNFTVKVYAGSDVVPAEEAANAAYDRLKGLYGKEGA